LTLETNTYFYKYLPVLPSDDAISQAQLAFQNQLAVQGYEQYQISAYVLRINNLAIIKTIGLLGII